MWHMCMNPTILDCGVLFYNFLMFTIILTLVLRLTVYTSIDPKCFVISSY